MSVITPSYRRSRVLNSMTVLLTVLLCACGQKGPLYLPDAHTKSTHIPSSSQAQP